MEPISRRRGDRTEEEDGRVRIPATMGGAGTHLGQLENFAMETVKARSIPSPESTLEELEDMLTEKDRRPWPPTPSLG